MPFMLEPKKIDLSRLNFEDISIGWNAVLRGTPAGTLFKIISSIFTALLLFIGILFWAKDAWTKYNDAAPHVQVSEISDPDLVVKGKMAKLNSEEQMKDDLISSQAEKIKSLQLQIDSLNEQISKRPDYYRCTIYDNDLKKLNESKQQIENTIQILLRPPQTKEQAMAGIYYSAAQLDVFTKQAAEYRKQATDIQEQIKVIELNRTQCK